MAGGRERHDSVSASRAAYLEELGPAGFDRLLAKIEAAHAQVRHCRRSSDSGASRSRRNVEWINARPWPSVSHLDAASF